MRSRLCLSLLLLAVASVAAAPAPRIALVESDSIGGPGLAAVLRESGVEATDVSAELLVGNLSLNGFQVFLIGTMFTASPQALAGLNAQAETIRRFVQRGGYVIEFSQADQNEGTVAWLPPGLAATRCDTDYGDVVPLKSDHPVLNTPHRLDLKQWEKWELVPGGTQAWPVVWESLDEQSGFEVIAARGRTGSLPAIMEGAYGKGRVLLTSLSPDRLRKWGRPAECREMALRLTENLLAHVQSVLAGNARPVAVTPKPVAPSLNWPVWKRERPADDYDAGTVGERPDGRIMVPTNQILEPAGKQILFPGRANDCVLSPDGRTLAVKGHAFLKLLEVKSGRVLATLAATHTYAGIAFSADGRTVYTGDTKGQVLVASLDEKGAWAWRRPLPLPGRHPAGAPVVLPDGTPAKPRASIPVGLALSADGRALWAVLNGSNALAQWDLAGGRVAREIDVERAPYGVALISDRKAYVTNWGGRIPRPGDPTALAPWEPIVVDARTQSAASGTVSVVDLDAGRSVRSIEVGLHPSAVILSPRRLRAYVANTNSDTVSVLNTADDAVVETIAVGAGEAGLFGNSPTALALSPDGALLYVANATANAVAVVRLSGPARAAARAAAPDRSEVRGALPTGWYPGGLAVTPDGRTLCVANVKGTGSRAFKGKGYSSHGHIGSVSLIPLPGERQLRAYTRRVEKNNRVLRAALAKLAPRPGVAPVPVPARVGEPSVFRHVLYIIKENRTYDQVFGDIERANGMEDLCLFGRQVTPNLHKIVDEFVLMDNFHCSGVLSADGHQWTDEAYCADYIERGFGGFVRSYPFDGGDAMAYSPTGFLWDNCLAHGKTVRNYGEMVKAKITPRGSWKDLYADFRAGTGKFSIQATATVETLRPYTCPDFIGFPGTVTDVYRASVFLRELKEFEAKGEMPNLMIMLLPNDHTSGTRPGIPTPRAQVADNDLAVGQILEALSRSKFWPETAVFVTEDDPQAGLDHVDGHRTVGIVASAYSRRGGQVISAQFNQTSMVRTIEQILGLPPMNQLDATATPMFDCFTARADLTPFSHVPNNIPLDEMNPEKTALSGAALHWAEVSEALPLDDIDGCDEDTFNRVIWHSVKGVNVPYPVLAKARP